MKIVVVKGAGEASTELSAFDAALKAAGVYNYNLIPLSSIIPPGSQVVKKETYDTPESEYGHKLYIVMSEIRSSEAGKFIAAGIGWYQVEDGKGVFVEHSVIGDTREVVESEERFRIENSLKDLCKFRDIEFEEERLKYEMSITQVKDHPACVLVIAVFQSEGWE